MERWWLSIALGSVSLVFLPILPTISVLILVALSLLVIGFKWRIFSFVAVILLSMSWSIYHAKNYLNQRVPVAIEGKQFRVLVKIINKIWSKNSSSAISNPFKTCV